MKIALTCPASLPATQFGGILFLCVDIATELSKLNHEVTIYTTDLDFANNTNTFNKKLPRIEKVHGFTIKRSHVFFKVKLFFVNPGLYRQIKNDHPEVIHAVGIRGFQTFVAALISKFKNIPLVVSDQGGLFTHPDFKKNLLNNIMYKLQEPMIRFIVKQAKKIIVANEYEKDIFLRFCDESKITIIRNGINLEMVNFPTSNFKEKYKIESPFILFLGRFNKVKGIDILLNAVNLIKDRKEFSNFKLIIMGVDFGFETEMLEMINELELKDIVLIIRNPSRDDVISAYRESKFLVLPSRWELSPLTPLEGFAFKKTVISTKAHGIPYLIKDGENSLLVEPENYKVLADAIIDLITDEKKCIDYGLAGYNMVQEICNSRIMAQNALKLYECVINR